MPRKPLIEAGSILPPQNPESGGDVMSRIIARDRERRQAEEETTSPPPPASVIREQSNHITDSMTNNITSNTESSISSNITGNKKRNTAGKEKEAAAGDGAGIADQIRRNLLLATAPAPLKVITLKLPPDLDQKIEEHCGRYHRKKQDVLRDAVLLYFEMLEKMEAEAGGAPGKGSNPLAGPTEGIL